MKYLINRASELVRGGCRPTCTVRVELNRRLCMVLENIRNDDDHIGVTAQRVLDTFAAAVCDNEGARKTIELAIQSGLWFAAPDPTTPGVELRKDAG